MIRDNFRPWGDFSWALSQFPNSHWGFIGCISMEDRCLSAWHVLHSHGMTADSLMFRIRDGESRYTERVEEKTDANETRALLLGIQQENIRKHRLLGRHGDVATDIVGFLDRQVEPNLVIDISSLPKKYFFFLIRKALSKPPALQNIIVTYTEPEAYCTYPLAENPEGWTPLPGFLAPRIEPADKTLIVGLGYEPLGLPELYSSGLFNNARIRLLFPFPAGPASVSRNWDFARLLEPVPGSAASNIERVDSLNVPDVFDKLVAITGGSTVYSILAPFGPKPLSLGMCLFAAAYSGATNPPSVFYTQPTVYNPDYSSGVRTVANNPAVHAYCIRLNGENLYRA